MLSEKDITGKELDISHPDCHVLYASNDEDLLQILEAADYFVSNHIISCRPHPPPLYIAIKSVLMVLRQLNHKHSKDLKPIFVQIMSLKERSWQGPSRPVKALFLAKCDFSTITIEPSGSRVTKRMLSSKSAGLVV